MVPQALIGSLVHELLVVRVVVVVVVCMCVEGGGRGQQGN